MTLPAVIFWVLLCWSLYKGGPLLLNMVFIALSFGTLSVIPPAVTGGITVLPESICAAAFVGRMLLNRDGFSWMLDAAVRFQKLGILALFMLIALVGAAFLPALFAGTPVIPFRPAGAVVLTSPLHSSAANITQSAYLLLSALMVLAFACASRSAQFQRQILRAILYGAITVVVTGIADMVAQKTGLAALLAPFRNATYSLNIDDTILGAQRIVGLMPEASSYGPLCVSFAALAITLRPFYPTKTQRRFCVALAAALVLLGWLSTSSTAILCLAVLGGIYALDWALRVQHKSALGRSSLNSELYIGMLIVTAVLLFVMFDPSVFQNIIALFNKMILDKTGSSSYAVRQRWNDVAWQAMLDTYGMGIGVGGSRASDGLVAVFSSTGLLGGVIYCGFILQAYLRPAGQVPWNSGMITALKLALLVPLAGSILTGTSPDFGAFIAMMIGTITGLSLSRQRARHDNAPAARRAIQSPVAPDGPPLQSRARSSN